MSDLGAPAPESPMIEGDAMLRRRRFTCAATLVIGTTLLAATLRVAPDSGWFTAVGLAAAATWITGALASGPIPLGADRPASWRSVALPAVAVGVIAFIGFLAAHLVGQRLPVVSVALDSVLTKADAGPAALVLVIALVNGVAEELFFRGALYDALGSIRPALTSTVVYVAVTAATGNIALVAAAVVMGTIFGLQRASTRGVLAPIVTHITWSTLMLLVLPR